MNILTRRQFIRSSAAAGTLTLGLNVFAPAFVKRQLMAAPVQNGVKFIYIYLDGGMDSLHFIQPHGDPAYSTANRPNLYVAPDEGIALDGSAPYPLDAAHRSWMGLHPVLAPLMPLYQAGRLAIINRVGYSNHSQSHFDGSQYFQNGTKNPNLEEGWVYRHLAESPQFQAGALSAIGLSSSLMTALRGAYAIPSIPDVKSFKFNGSEQKTLKLLGSTGPNRGLLGSFAQPGTNPTRSYEDLVRRTGNVVAGMMNLIKANGINPDTYIPTNGAVYPNNSFGQKLKTAAMFFRETEISTITLRLGGFDTHTNQGRLTGGLPNLMTQIAQGLQALFQDLQGPIWDNTIIQFNSEFSRTTIQNGSEGTDHGSSSLCILAGGRIKGGIFNAPTLTDWMSDNGSLSQSGRYIAYRTDFRSINATVLKAMGDTPAMIDRIIPGYSGLAAATPAKFATLPVIA